MLDIAQLIGRLLFAVFLGSIMGLERSLVGKEAGIRTSMLVAGGAAIFTMIGLELPYIAAPNPNEVSDIIAGSTFMNIIANIVVGIGFLGAGIIIKTQEHVYGLTTAASVWATAGIGVLVGVGMFELAIAATTIFAGLLFILRKLDIETLINRRRDRG